MPADEVASILADAAAEAASTRTAWRLNDLIHRGVVLDVETAAAAAAEGARYGVAKGPVPRRAELEVATASAAAAAGVANRMLVATRSPPSVPVDTGFVSIDTVIACASAAAGAVAGVFLASHGSTSEVVCIHKRRTEDRADAIAIACAAAAAAVSPLAAIDAGTPSLAPRANGSVLRHFVLAFSIGVAALAVFAVIFRAV